MQRQLESESEMRLQRQHAAAPRCLAPSGRKYLLQQLPPKGDPAADVADAGRCVARASDRRKAPDMRKDLLSWIGCIINRLTGQTMT